MNRRSFISGTLVGLLLTRYPWLSAMDDNKALSKFNKTGLIHDPLFLRHHIAKGHPEAPERIKYIDSAMKKSGIMERLNPITIKANVTDWIKTVHTEAHINSIRNTAPVAHRVATAGVGAGLAALDRVATNRLDNAFCASRPPGHHALNTGKEEGFCYYNNIAIAARYAQQQYGLKKILIVDWDYHHGNATEAMFYDDPSVLFFSTHDFYAYPGTGHPDKTGTGNGLGYNINVHLDCGTDDRAIVRAFEQILLPAADRFKPDIVLVSAGFDSRRDDPLGCFDITDNGFIALTKIVMRIANRHCQGKLVSILEGGYNYQGNAQAVVAHISTLLTKSTT